MNIICCRVSLSRTVSDFLNVPILNTYRRWTWILLYTFALFRISYFVLYLFVVNIKSDAYSFCKSLFISPHIYNVHKIYKKLSYCWETVRRESMPRIAEMDVEMTPKLKWPSNVLQGHQKWHQLKASVWFPISSL